MEKELSNLEQELAYLIKVDINFKSKPSLDSPSYIFLRTRQIRQKKDEIRQKKDEMRKYKEDKVKF